MSPAPLVLAVETATRTLALALLRGGEAVAVHRSHDERAHSERILPALDALLAEAGCSLDAVEAFVVSIGPGSFTGLRIGLATVKGLAFAPARPVVPVSTLAGIAASADSPDPVVALLDARRGEAYTAFFQRPGHEWEPAERECVLDAEALAARLPAQCTLVPGEDSAEIAARAAEKRGTGVRVLPATAGEACALRIGRLGQLRLAAEGGVASEALQPRYIRRAEAEVRRTGERFEGPTAR